MRSIADTDPNGNCNGYGNGNCHRCAYRDANSNSNTDAEEYSDAETSADSAPEAVAGNVIIVIGKTGTREITSRVLAYGHPGWPHWLPAKYVFSAKGAAFKPSLR